mgnify:CR=1 FL=1
MASVYREHYEKEIFIFNEILKRYHPLISDMVKDLEVELSLDILCKNNLFNIEIMCEHAVAHVGGLELSNEHGQDYSDESEQKVVSMSKNSENDNGYRVTIKNIHRKKDLIRLIVYNKVKKRLDYFVFKLSDIGFDKQTRTRLDPYYNPNKDTYSIIQNYKVNSFEELCMKKG